VSSQAQNIHPGRGVGFVVVVVGVVVVVELVGVVVVVELVGVVVVVVDFEVVVVLGGGGLDSAWTVGVAFDVPIAEPFLLLAVTTKRSV
jgi:hypothetical protein